MPNEILIEVAYALPKKQLIIPVKVKQGITAEEAIKLSGIVKKFPEINLEVNQSFTTQNTKHYPDRIDLKLIDGPFKVLEGYWIFTKINEEACSIEFHLHYEFSNFILDKLISPIFSQIANTFVDGFVTQADKIYTK